MALNISYSLKHIKMLLNRPVSIDSAWIIQCIMTLFAVKLEKDIIMIMYSSILRGNFACIST